MSSSSQEDVLMLQVHRGCIALNNFGVKLLQKGSPHCLSTFQSTIRSMRTLFLSASPQDGSSHSDLHRVAVQLQRDLQKASSQMMHDSLQEQTKSPQDTIVSQIINIHAITTGDNNDNKPSSRPRDLQESYNNTVYPVRLDDVESLMCCYEDDPNNATTNTILEMHTAAVLQNLALAEFCLSLRHSTMEARASCTVELISMSQDILDRLSMQCAEEGLVFLHRQVLCLSHAVVQSKLAVLKVYRRLPSSNHTTSDEGIQELNELLEYLRDALDKLAPWSPGRLLTTAAAA